MLTAIVIIRLKMRIQKKKTAPLKKRQLQTWIRLSGWPYWTIIKADMRTENVRQKDTLYLARKKEKTDR